MAVSAATKLRLYNAALRIIRETKLSSASEVRESRRVLDDIWDDGAIDDCLELGIWHFAKRTISLTYDPSITPAFGLAYAFTHPTDFIRLVDMCQDEHLQVPLTQYRENAGYWFADLDTIYLSYVSNDDAAGTDTSLWPGAFRRVVEAFLADRLSLGITCSSEMKIVAANEFKHAVTDAKSLGAMSQPVRFAPPTSWQTARGGGGNGDRGSRSRLIG